MTCLNYHFKPNYDGAFRPSIYHYPCGKCEECQNFKRNSWSWRLSAEMEYLKSNGYQLAFCTLTYREQTLPVLPSYCFSDPMQQKYSPRVPCFFRPDARKFLDSMKKYFHKKKVRGIRYFLASENGEHTDRPHYHVFFGFPSSRSFSPDGECLNPFGVSLRDFYNWVKEYWVTRYGYIFPRDKFYFGGFDFLNHWHNGFEITAPTTQAAYYVSKYVCKDVAFERKENFYNLIDRKYRKAYLPFHLQSKSLGLDFLRNMSDSDKVHLLEKGRQFDGGKFCLPCPLYIKNHLFFDTHFVLKYENGKYKRLPQRCVSEFFINNAAVILHRKVDIFEKIFSDLRNSSVLSVMDKHGFLKNRSINEIVQDTEKKYSSREIAEFYVTYYGYTHANCAALPRVDAFIVHELFPHLSSYRELLSLADFALKNDCCYYMYGYFEWLKKSLPVFSDLECISARKFDLLSNYISYVLSYLPHLDDGEPLFAEDELEAVRQYHKGLD